MEGCVVGCPLTGRASVGGEQWETGGRQRCELRDCSPTDRRPGPRVIPEWLRYGHFQTNLSSARAGPHALQWHWATKPTSIQKNKDVSTSHKKEGAYKAPLPLPPPPQRALS
jgi:hypothetical protein